MTISTDDNEHDSRDQVALVVLAAGQGTRMRSALPKPLHLVAGLPMVSYVLRAGAAAKPIATVLVVSTVTADLAERLGLSENVISVTQDRPCGTGDAVRCAVPAVRDVGAAWIVVLYADHPLLDGATVQSLVDGARSARALATVLTCRVADAKSYGRIVRDERDRFVRIVERKDDNPEFRSGLTEINSGMMALDARWAAEALAKLEPSQVSGEYYLTDLVEMAIAEGEHDGRWPVATVEAAPEVALGINDRADLAVAEEVVRERIRRRLMLSGVTLVGPETIFVDDDVEVGADTTIFPFSLLRAGTRVGERCVIGPQTVLERALIGDDVVVRSSTVTEASVGPGSDVGPYAHLRPGVAIGAHVHIGNYAELKNVQVADDVKVGHFSYLGDASIGEGTNVGAGTITANYDGAAKHRTEIGERVFLGSDTILRAPVRLGADARTGAGSVVTKDVPAGALVVGVPARIVKRAADSPSEEGSG